MIQDQKPNYAKRNSFSQMGAVGLIAPLPQERRQSFAVTGPSGFQALSALSNLDSQQIERNRAVSFEQSTLVF